MSAAGGPVVGDDGSNLLTSAAAGELLTAVVGNAGGRLLRWRLDHVDARPGRSTTATYTARVQWPDGARDELLGASARVDPGRGHDARAVMFGDGRRKVAVWLHPHDPDLPGLAHAAVAERLADLLTDHRVLGTPVAPRDLRLEMVSYRPRRRAVLRAYVRTAAGPVTCYLKVLREQDVAAALHRHRLLAAAGVPAPEVLAATADGVLVLRAVPGRSLATSVFDEEPPCRAEDLVGLLDALPPEVADLPRRTPWADAVTEYAELVASTQPDLGLPLRRVTAEVTAGLVGAAAVPGVEATHGDFHEGQVFVAGGRVSGLVDIDTAGPGRRVDDLACLLAHLSTIQRMSATQADRLGRLLRAWLPVLDARVDPRELRLRAAAVVVSLATGPYRGQEPGWPATTAAMVAVAARLTRSAAER